MDKNLIALFAKILEGVKYIVFGGLLLKIFCCIFASWVLDDFADRRLFVSAGT
jgi:hypothetical protein